MTRLALGLLVVAIGSGGWQPAARAQAQPPAGGQAPATGASASASIDLAAPKEDDATAGVADLTAPRDPNAVAARRSAWEDIVVVPRKSFLKDGRVELAPFSGISINDVLVRHYSFGADFRYFITDVLSVGLEGQYFIKQRTQRESVTGLQYNRIAALNKFNFAAGLNFDYVPGYGKFSLFNRYIMHWEILASLGAGWIQTEILPRTPGDAAFKNDNITANFGIGTRFFLGNWLTVNFALKDAVFNDKFEPADRKKGEKLDVVKQRAGEKNAQFVHNVMVYAGVGFFLPSSFQYKTGR